MTPHGLIEDAEEYERIAAQLQPLELAKRYERQAEANRLMAEMLVKAWGAPKFKIGDTVRVLPFEVLCDSHDGDVDGEADLVFGIFKRWLERYQTRTYTVAGIAETAYGFSYRIQPDLACFFWPEYALEKA